MASDSPPSNLAITAFCGLTQRLRCLSPLSNLFLCHSFEARALELHPGPAAHNPRIPWPHLTWSGFYKTREARHPDLWRNQFTSRKDGHEGHASRKGNYDGHSRSRRHARLITDFILSPHRWLSRPNQLSTCLPTRSWSHKRGKRYRTASTLYVRPVPMTDRADARDLRSHAANSSFSP
ncbi:hypothetical protein BDN72DRAFT_688824 [Pluteus cervinus]|uniref:Uncharacterized protein n=1 Tax=Pluteus cervinus TaxID=181527 RepID=A0ACD3AQV5_9AGAR|nr:hypothetical protein BDN72DRAFT_688824 [Pluteus cervinus]